ncbi:MAG: hypothetical protein JW771_03375 [Candidatus Thermoplasmatota archaeon]|nr:hypothetical protein [Candidatus Thermoplasmatota archaeon]
MKKTYKIMGASITIVLLLLVSAGTIAAVQTKQLALRQHIVGYATPQEDEPTMEDLTYLLPMVPHFETYYAGEQPTEWTPDGFFIGVWGLYTPDAENNFTVLGYLGGYYKGQARRGSYVGMWNTTNNSYIGYLAGVYRGPFTHGVINVSGGENRLPFVGFLLKNETLFFGRVMSLIGPPVYMIGFHQPLNTQTTTAVQSQEQIQQQHQTMQPQGNTALKQVRHQIMKKA